MNNFEGDVDALGTLTQLQDLCVRPGFYAYIFAVSDLGECDLFSLTR